MNLTKLDDNLFVSPQISLDDIATLKAEGFATIICNRPDDEDFGQPEFNDIAEAAKAAGMEVAHQPIAGPADLSPEAGAEFGNLLENMPKPALAYCRSGNRCTHLYQLAVSQK